MSFTRRTFLTVLAAGTALVSLLPHLAAPAFADVQSEARDLIKSMASTVIGMLGNKGVSSAQREAKFREIYRANFDHPVIGRYVMGRAWAQASESERTEYLGLFETYIAKVYSAQLATYKGETFDVQGSEADGDGAVVNSRIVDKQRTVEIKWRLRKTAGRLLVRDVIIEGLSMSLTQQREFASVFQARGGTPAGLIKAIREKIGQLNKGA